MLIAFEGIDGSGKSSTSNSVYKELVALGVNTKYVAFPTEAALVKLLDKEITALDQLEIFMRDHLDNLAKMKAESEVLWIMDRSYISMFVYQFYRSPETIHTNIYQSGLRELFSPYKIDITYWFDAPLEVCNERIQYRINLGINDNLLTKKEYNNLFTGYNAEIQKLSKVTRIIHNYLPRNTHEEVIKGITNDLCSL